MANLKSKALNFQENRWNRPKPRPRLEPMKYGGFQIPVPASRWSCAGLGGQRGGTPQGLKQKTCMWPRTCMWLVSTGRTPQPPPPECTVPPTVLPCAPSRGTPSLPVVPQPAPLPCRRGASPSARRWRTPAVAPAGSSCRRWPPWRPPCSS